MAIEGLNRSAVPVYRKVAMPPRFIFAPAALGMVVDGVAIVGCLVVMLATGGAGLVLFLVVGVHMVLAALGAREPQIDNLVKAWFEKPRVGAPREGQRSRSPGAKWVLSP